MVSPRFAKLSPEQQQRIMSAALAEFAAHGFHDASLNRVIEAAGISKGSLYYYFDGKEDLYAHVARTELEKFFTDHGPFPVPEGTDAATFWSTLESYYARVLIALDGAPQLAALIRGWVAAATNPALQQAQRDMEQAVLPWLEKVLHAGQETGAVRTDVPDSLLLATLVGMGQAMDYWVMTQRPDRSGLVRLARTLTEMIKGAIGPTGDTPEPARQENRGGPLPRGAEGHNEA